jgi:hypothetical protein
MQIPSRSTPERRGDRTREEARLWGARSARAAGAERRPHIRSAGVPRFLGRSTAFFKALGFSENPQFTGDNGACMVFSDTIVVMLLTHARSRDFTPRAICDTSQAVEVLHTLSCASREEVDDLVAGTLAAGGSTYDTAEDLGFMYSHSFVDPGGHGWGLVHMSAMPEQA